jgi:hypothetical protein
MSFYEYAYQRCKKLFEILRPIRENGSRAATNSKDPSKKAEKHRDGISVETSRKS